MDQDTQQLYEKVRQVTPETFEAVALEVFVRQATHNPLYAEYLQLLGMDPKSIQTTQSIPHLPITFFKSYRIQTGRWNPEKEFTSSGTTGSEPSRHLLRSSAWYRENALRGFKDQYGNPSDFCFLALLPSYLERSGSSLVEMVHYFQEESRQPYNGFFLRDLEGLQTALQRCREEEIPTVLIGVSFALWEFAERYPMDLSDVIIMETGGMKGRRRELVRPELHAILQMAFQAEHIHSEYGMTELLSQAYAPSAGRFMPAPTMRVGLADLTDPFAPPLPGRSGQLLITDLANADSCSFIATEDIGRVHADGTFDVLGRLDRAAWRGCNLMVWDQSAGES